MGPRLPAHTLTFPNVADCREPLAPQKGHVPGVPLGAPWHIKRHTFFDYAVICLPSASSWHPRSMVLRIIARASLQKGIVLCGLQRESPFLPLEGHLLHMDAPCGSSPRASALHVTPNCPG